LTSFSASAGLARRRDCLRLRRLAAAFENDEFHQLAHLGRGVAEITRSPTRVVEVVDGAGGSVHADAAVDQGPTKPRHLDGADRDAMSEGDGHRVDLAPLGGNQRLRPRQFESRRRQQAERPR
jgi:hypothetical protein